MTPLTLIRPSGDPAGTTGQRGQLSKTGRVIRVRGVGSTRSQSRPQVSSAALRPGLLRGPSAGRTHPPNTNEVSVRGVIGALFCTDRAANPLLDRTAGSLRSPAELISAGASPLNEVDCKSRLHTPS